MKALVTIFVFIGFIVLSLTLGTFCTQYSLLHIFHHTIPTIWAVLLTLVTGDATIPIAIIVKVLVLLGILS